MTFGMDEMFRRALVSLQAGNANEAERLLKILLGAQPRHLAGLNLTGILLTQLGRFEEAEHYVQRALRENVKSDTTFYNYGIILKALGRPTEALERFSQALAINAAVAESWNNRGTVFNDLKRYREAIADFDKAISLNSNYPDAFCNKGKSLTELKLYDQSLDAYDRALKLKPDFAEAWFGRGNVFTELKQYDNAFAAYDRALKLKPDLAGAWLGRGNLFSKLKRYSDAFAAYDKALKLRPDFAEAWLGRGNIFSELKQYNEANAAYDKALTLKSDLAEAWLGRGNVFVELKQHNDAFAAFDRALTSNPDLAGAWLGRGNLLIELKQYNDANAAYDQALKLKPDLAEAWLGRGNVFTKLRQYNDANVAYDRALTLKPDLAEAWLGRGVIFTEFKQRNDAFAAYDCALTYNPDLAGAWLGRGNLFTELKRFDDALLAYDRALKLKPDLAEAWLSRGIIFTELNQCDDAFAAFDKALTINPEFKFAEGFRLYSKLLTCDWTNQQAEVSRLLLAIRDDRLASPPFVLFSISSSSADQLKCAQNFTMEKCVAPAVRYWQGDRYSHDRIRVAYVSADFRDHAVSYLLAEVFERHDRSRFETYAISLTADQSTPLRERLRKAFDQFVVVEQKSDREVAALLREMEIDIVVDLMGYTRGERSNIFAMRPAPIQVSYLGYAGTTGADYIDYILADKFVIPEEQRQFYSEKPIYLPDTFMATDSKRVIAERTPTRKEQGLPETGFVFCSFNQSFKFAPAIFIIWMRLLREVKDSVLWLSGLNDRAVNNLRREATACDVKADRLIFAPRVEKNEDHLARHRLADLFLDTQPYNAHTSTIDALWTGLPVVSCLGSTFAGRVAGSLLNAVGLAELITLSLEEYEALALRIARDPSLLASLKDKLARNRDSYPLFNAERITRHIEAAYTTMWKTWQRGELPHSFCVEPIDRAGEGKAR